MCIENDFFIGPKIIFRGKANLFLGLQCFGALAVEVDWFETLTSLGDHFENFAMEECFQRECQVVTVTGKETKVVFIFLTNSSRSQYSLCVCDEVFWTEDLIEETTKGLHDSYTILTFIEHDMSA